MANWLLYAFLRYITYLGNLFPQFLICCFLLYLDFDKGYQVGSLWFYGYLVNLIIKNSIRKERPPRQQWKVPHVNGWSFPSGHSLTSLILYWSIVKYFAVPLPLSLVFYSIPIILGCSRLFLRVHFVEDVLAGWLIAYMYLHFFEDTVLKFQEQFQGLFYQVTHFL